MYEIVMWHYLHDMENSASQIKGFLWEYWNGDPIRGTYMNSNHYPTIRSGTLQFPTLR